VEAIRPMMVAFSWLALHRRQTAEFAKALCTFLSCA